jgi:hypothetical protein
MSSVDRSDLEGSRAFGKFFRRAKHCSASFFANTQMTMFIPSAWRKSFHEPDGDDPAMAAANTARLRSTLLMPNESR